MKTYYTAYYKQGDHVIPEIEAGLENVGAFTINVDGETYTRAGSDTPEGYQAKMATGPWYPLVQLAREETTEDKRSTIRTKQVWYYEKT